ncbi:copper resistance D family protein [Amycolatopsis sp. NPDC059657]|uniref:copper resistance D family protein n=1 Tax=Amycolatopsis sp. NPDC059657 TaxID=3346899 RepID=UPI00366B396E
MDAQAVYVVARCVDYFGMSLFFGGLFFVAVLWPGGVRAPGTRKVIAVGWVLGLLGTVAGIGLQGAWAAQRPAGDFLDLDLIREVLDGQFGRIWVSKALLWVLAGVVLADLLRRGENAARSWSWRIGAGAIMLGVLRVTGMTGHAVESTRPLLSQVADFAHLAGICAWIGGLAVLLFGVLSSRDPDVLALVVPRFSKLAMGSVLLLILAGLVLAWQTVGTLERLFGTEYGRILLIKLAVLAVVLLFAQVSKFWVSKRLDAAVSSGATVRPFVYSVAAENALVILVLLAASFLVTASPGR